MSRAPRAIRTRILAAFLICIGLFSGALIYSLGQISRIGSQVEIMSTTYHPILWDTAQMRRYGRQFDREHDSIRKEETQPQPGHIHRIEKLFSSMQTHIDHIDDLLRDASESPDFAQEVEFGELLADDLRKINEASDRYQELLAVWIEASPEDRLRTQEELSDHRDALIIEINFLAEHIKDRITILGTRTTNAKERAYSIGGALALSGILLGAMLAGVALFTLRPIGELTQQVQRLAAGDYTGRVDVGSTDEMGLLAQEFNAMAEAVQERDRILVERAKALDQLSLRLRRILDTIQAGLVVFREGQVSTVNPAATRYWSLHEGDPLPEALAGLDIGSHLSTPQGDRIFDVEVVPFGESGRLLVGEDVTDRIAAQERLARSERLALVGRMLAQITHEVRNPLNAMSLNAELLSEDLAHTPQSDMVATISSEIRRLDQLTGRYLELSRGRRSELNPVDPLELIRDVQKAENQALQQSGISCEIHGESPGVVEVDTDALRRAFLNILRNASEAGAQNITVHLQTESEQMKLHVRDDGPGIEEEQLNRIFEPFFTTKASGTGLGLAISRQELEEVGGSLQVVSKKDHGCTFLLEIPIRQS